MFGTVGAERCKLLERVSRFTNPNQGNRLGSSRSSRPRAQYYRFAQCVAEKKAHAVESRARTVNREYLRKLHEADKIAGTRCAAPRTQSGHCSYGPEIEHSEGGGERYFHNTFGEVQPLVFGHFGELNTRFHELISRTCLLYTSPSPRDRTRSRMPSSA